MRASLLPPALALAWLMVLAPTAPGALVAQVPERHEHAGDHGDALGVVEFANSGAPAAQRPFLRGLALLHSFEYGEAAESFQDAQVADPGFAMAYWAEALTYTHPLWGEDDAAAARLVLARLGSTPEARLARAGSARERAYGAAIESYYRDAPHAARARAFADAMQRVARQYPADVDAAAFAALAAMTHGYVGDMGAAERDSLRLEAIAFAEHAFAQSPQHPGAVHYLIHATDHPAHARRGLAAAQVYAATAPDAEHALHMPSHIFLQLGMWDEVVSTNERAWAASRAEVVKRGLPNTALSFHALQWLQYGYLQQGRDGAAAALVDTARAVLTGLDLTVADAVDARVTEGWLSFAVAAHAVEPAGARPALWTGTVCEQARGYAQPAAPVSERDSYMQLTATYRAVVAGAACGVGRDDVKYSALLGSVRTRLTALAADNPDAPMLRLAITHADALEAIRRGDDAAAIALLETLPAGTPLVGPPATLRTQELLGSALLRAGRAQEAVAAFEKSLELTPGRVHSLLGLARASHAAGQEEKAERAYLQLPASWQSERGDSASRQNRRVQ